VSIARIARQFADSVLMLGAEEIAALADLDSVIESQRHAFIGLADGGAQAPSRLLLNGPADSVAFCYASRLTPPWRSSAPDCRAARTYRPCAPSCRSPR
jgi:hypothetical protein